VEKKTAYRKMEMRKVLAINISASAVYIIKIKNHTNKNFKIN